MAYGPDQILEGLGNSDYERYIRTPELLSLQKSPEQWLHRDELLVFNKCFGITSLSLCN